MTHQPEGSAPPIDGYVSCRRPGCRRIVLVEVAHVSRGLCDECVRAGHLPTYRDVAFIVGGQRHGFGAYAPRRRASDRDRAKIRERYRRNRRAARRAQTRLKNVFPELYDLILGEERAREGLEPFPLACAIERAEDTGEWEQLLAEMRAQ